MDTEKKINSQFEYCMNVAGAWMLCKYVVLLETQKFNNKKNKKITEQKVKLNRNIYKMLDKVITCK